MSATSVPHESHLTARPLDQLFQGGADIAAFLRVAVRIVDALAELHRSGLIHRNIKPQTILVDGEAGAVRFTDLSMASRLEREPPLVKSHKTIEGTLAYMSPEQTGRMNRWIDYRTDFYSLGVTFYQMLTGRLPFEARDALEWVHCHVARSPGAPIEIDPSIPAPLSDIVMKLLSKTAEDRYQSAAGLRSDLERCLDQWLAQGRIEAFPLAARDVPERFEIPQHLYGREAEVEQLLGVFGRVVESGAPELVLVSGYSGVGKSSLVNELHRPVVRERGAFVSAKFDQYKRNIPYSTIEQAFRRMVQEILTESEEKIGLWRERLRGALGESGRIIIDLIPEVELVIGEQPEVPELPPGEAQNRFNRVVQRFLGAFARADHPVALFLDDLQWADAASLDLITHVITHPDTRYLLVIGAYRENEVNPSHPLMLALDRVRKAGGAVREMVLSPLSAPHLRHLIADALHRRPEEVEGLARLVHERTAGNPFFAIQFLLALQEEHLIELDPEAAGFRWDMARIKAKGFTDNVVDLMVDKLKRLPAPTQEALKQLACLGNVAELATLETAFGRAAEALHADLWEAVRAGLVVRMDSAYRFLHDRIQEAAYSLIPEGERAAVHLEIGRVLSARTPPGELEEKIFEIVNHFDLGAALITSQEERARVAELDLIAGKRAKASTAYAPALRYLAAGAALLPEDSWERRYELAFALEFHRAECEHLTGDPAAAEARLSALARRAAGIVDMAAVTCALVGLYTTMNRSDRAVEVGLEYLRRAGTEWSPHPTDEEARSEYDSIWQKLGSRPVEGLVSLPPMTDPGSRATLDVLTCVQSPALFTDKNLLCLVVCRMANLSLDHGNSDASCLAYVWLGMLLGPRFGDYRMGYRFGKLGFDLLESRGILRFKARVYNGFGHRVNPWARHLSAGFELLRRGFQAAQETGDITYAVYNKNCLITLLLAGGEPLEEVQREAENALEFVRNARFGLVVDIVTAQLRLIRALRGLLPDLGSFNDAQFDERDFEQRLEANPRLAIAACWYWIRKLQARFHADDHAAALEAAEKARPLLWTSASFFEEAEYHFYGALARAARLDAAPADERPMHLAALASHHERLATWAENCPENFGNRAALVAAEIARVERRDQDAMRLYEEALRSAREHRFVNHEAIAYEAAARFYRARGFELFADTYLREARACYARWGADGKVRQLERRHPALAPRRAFAPTEDFAASAAQLELLSVIKASQSISGEILLPNLQQTLIRILIEAAGAQKGCLVRSRGGDLRMEIEASLDEGGRDVRVLEADVALSAAPLPASILNYVKRTRELVILDDAAKEARFAADPYIAAEGPRSILCLPLLRQAQLVGLLYLENNMAAGAFTPDRVEILSLLASQAAISLENAALYADLSQENVERRRAEEQVRKLNEELEARVADRTAALVSANKELEAFSYSISHDLRAPLRTVDTFSRALLEDCGDRLGDEGHEHLARIRKATQRTLELIDDLLKLSRITRGEMTRRRVDLSEMARDILAELARAEPRRRVETAVADGLVVDGDERLLRVALENLLGNAWKFTGKREGARIELGATEQEDGRIAYHVRDNGAGFDMQFAERLFKPFHRMHRATDFPGTGIGLATVQRIITRHGGRLWAESAVDQGSTFYFTLRN